MRAESIAGALSGRKVGGCWMARCPAHDDRKPSLAIRQGTDGKVLVRCHAGCDQERLIAALRSLGLLSQNCYRKCLRSTPRATINRRLHHDAAKRREAALAVCIRRPPLLRGSGTRM